MIQKTQRNLSKRGVGSRQELCNTLVGCSKQCCWALQLAADIKQAGSLQHGIEVAVALAPCNL